MPIISSRGPFHSIMPTGAVSRRRLAFFSEVPAFAAPRIRRTFTVNSSLLDQSAADRVEHRRLRWPPSRPTRVTCQAGSSHPTGYGRRWDSFARARCPHTHAITSVHRLPFRYHNASPPPPVRLSWSRSWIARTVVPVRTVYVNLAKCPWGNPAERRANPGLQRVSGGGAGDGIAEFGGFVRSPGPRPWGRRMPSW